MANIWIFASGTRNGWWSGLKKLLERVESWEIEWVENIVVVSNHVKWWVYDIVNKYEGSVYSMYIKDLIQKDVDYILQDFLMNKREYNVRAKAVVKFTEDNYSVMITDILVGSNNV